MKKQRLIDFTVGLFMLLGILSFFVLAFKVSGLTSLSDDDGYTVSAEFSDIGGLKVRAPVTIAGVKVGEVTDIELKNTDLNAIVTMRIDAGQDKIPFDDVQARILTQGLLGSNYISIVPGFDEEEEPTDHPYLREGDKIGKTQQAMILENLIGQLIFNINK
jgi:phospholipid/cholesterol/gamma-HCH transport system substrate-binding protein